MQVLIVKRPNWWCPHTNGYKGCFFPCPLCGPQSHSVFLAEVGPKKILDLMNVPWLTRENVASHLQVDPLTLSVLVLKISKSHYLFFFSFFEKPKSHYQVGFLQHVAFPLW